MATHMWRKVLRDGCCQLKRKTCHRPYCSSTNGPVDINSISLSETVPGFVYPKSSPSSNHKQHDTQVTTLSNGLKVASENTYGQFSTVGVVIDSGSRYEVAYLSGITHFLEKLAFGRTVNFESRDMIRQELERVAGICDAQGSKDTFVYAMSAQTAKLAKAIDILADVVCRSIITDQALDDARTSIGFELESIKMNPNPEPMLMEMIHGAAYRDNTLGLPRNCPPENIAEMDSRMLYTFLKNFHTPERMVLAGVGMEHDLLVELAEKYFVQRMPIWSTDKVVIDPSKSVDNSVSQYTGGIVKVEADLSNVSLGPNPMPELAHFVIGLESCSHQDPDFIAYCVLNMLLGGGGSFSAGGPGKGMYSRLYLNVLNQHNWVHMATAYNMAYADSGLFSIQASSHPEKLGELVTVILRELVNATGSINEVELSRAKVQLQSVLLMNLESRPVIFEDIGRQVLIGGERKPSEHYFDSIGSVTAKDIKRVAERMLRSKPSVAVYGSLHNMPDIGYIQSTLLEKPKNATARRAFSLFGGR